MEKKNSFIALLFTSALIFTMCQKKSMGHLKIPSTYELEIVGEDYIWTVLHPGVDGKLYTTDDVKSKDILFLPANQDVKIYLKSKDYIYFSYIRSLGVSGVAVNGVDNHINFYSGESDSLIFEGNQMCGFKHQSLDLDIVVQEKDLFFQSILTYYD